MLIGLYFALILSLLIYSLEGDNTWFQEVPRIVGYSGSIISLFNIFMTNLILLSKSVSRECRGFMFGFGCAFGALGAIAGLTIGQLIHDGLNHESLFVFEILLCVIYVIVF